LSQDAGHGGKVDQAQVRIRALSAARCPHPPCEQPFWTIRGEAVGGNGGSRWQLANSRSGFLRGSLRPGVEYRPEYRQVSPPRTSLHRWGLWLAKSAVWRARRAHPSICRYFRASLGYANRRLSPAKVVPRSQVTFRTGRPVRSPRVGSARCESVWLTKAIRPAHVVHRRRGDRNLRLLLALRVVKGGTAWHVRRFAFPICRARRSPRVKERQFASRSLTRGRVCANLI